MRRGFSLVELSIVLVILGLLVGGILAGQSMIRASELRAVGTEMQRYNTAVYAFRDKYFAVPGDMTNATSLWGDQATGTSSCPSAATADGSPGTCNGDGNGQIGPGAASGGEGVRAWQQLALAGLIDGGYTGYYDTGSKLTIGLNVPRSKYPNVGWALLYRGTAAAAIGIWDHPSNYLQTGSESASELWGYAFSSQDTWNLDTKLDDGVPDQGAMLAGSPSASTSCYSPSGGTHNTGPVAGRAYTLSSSGGQCHLFFKTL